MDSFWRALWRDQYFRLGMTLVALGLLCILFGVAVERG